MFFCFCCGSVRSTVVVSNRNRLVLPLTDMLLLSGGVSITCVCRSAGLLFPDDQFPSAWHEDWNRTHRTSYRINTADYPWFWYYVVLLYDHSPSSLQASQPHLQYLSSSPQLYSLPCSAPRLSIRSICANSCSGRLCYRQLFQAGWHRPEGDEGKATIGRRREGRLWSAV
jgi:hypothetical protein